MPDETKTHNLEPTPQDAHEKKVWEPHMCEFFFRGKSTFYLRNTLVLACFMAEAYDNWEADTSSTPTNMQSDKETHSGWALCMIPTLRVAQALPPIAVGSAFFFLLSKEDTCTRKKNTWELILVCDVCARIGCAKPPIALLVKHKNRTNSFFFFGWTRVLAFCGFL